MSYFFWLGLTLVFVVAVALTGHAPRGAKPVARTGLMRAARAVLVAGIIACGVMGFWDMFRH